jgi:hypothetical protein
MEFLPFWIFRNAGHRCFVNVEPGNRSVLHRFIASWIASFRMFPHLYNITWTHQERWNINDLIVDDKMPVNDQLPC